jgi:hypothetical protein
MRKGKLAALVTVALAGAVAGSSVGALSGPSSPFSVYVGLGHNAAVERSIYDAEESERQAAIQMCMASLGMPYVMLGAHFNVLEPVGQSAEFFGLVAPFGSTEKSRGETILQDDPNIMYAQSLEDPEQSKYYEALFGRDWLNPNQSMDDYQASCTGAAYAKVPGLAAEIAPLRNEYMIGRSAAIKADPRVVTATEDWSQCMSNRGLQVSSWEDMLGQLEGRLDEALADGRVLSVQEYAMLIDLEKRMYEANQSCDDDVQKAVQAAVLEFDSSFLEEHSTELAAFHRDHW